MLYKIDNFDRIVSLSVSKIRISYLTFILKYFTYSARGFAWFFYTALLALFNILGIQFLAKQEVLQIAFIAPLIAWIVGTIIKKKYRRKRPFQAMKNFPSLVHSPINDSFPSMHAGSTMAFFTALSVSHHPWANWFCVWAVIVIFSRLYLGVHYLSDLLGGILLGILCGQFIKFI